MWERMWILVDVRTRLRDLGHCKVGWGYGRMYMMILNMIVEGKISWGWDGAIRFRVKIMEMEWGKLLYEKMDENGSVWLLWDGHLLQVRLLQGSLLSQTRLFKSKHTNDEQFYSMHRNESTSMYFTTTTLLSMATWLYLIGSLISHVQLLNSSCKSMNYTCDICDCCTALGPSHLTTWWVSIGLNDQQK